jgi:hypothetical protein
VNVKGPVHKLISAIAASVALALVLPASSAASRSPTKAEEKAILQAAPGNSYPPGWAHLTVRVSTVDSKWAAVYIRPNRGHAHQVQSDVSSVYHTKHHGWVTHQDGNGRGCGVPARVRHDLKLGCF